MWTGDRRGGSDERDKKNLQSFSPSIDGNLDLNLVADLRCLNCWSQRISRRRKGPELSTVLPELIVVQCQLRRASYAFSGKLVETDMVTLDYDYVARRLYSLHTRWEIAWYCWPAPAGS